MKDKEIEMEQKDIYPNKCKEITSGLVAIARKSELPIAKVSGIYDKFNNRVYREDLNKGGVGGYKPELEEKALKLTERYFRRYSDIQKN
ncbi:MAG: hypothetical protein ABIE36_00585 [Candidatus Diapherotrites archaeon]